MMTRYIVVLSIVAGVLMVGAIVASRYQRDMDAAKSRLAADGRTLDTPCGGIEYGDKGDGPVVLVIHGAGGGFDQGLTLGELMVGDGYRIIAPSRFGYAHAPIPADSSLEAQADAYICLLDALGVEGPVDMVGFSAGGPSSLMFSSRHAGRVRRLVMVAAVSHSAEVNPDLAGQVKAINVAMRGDFLYWAANETLQPQLLSLLGVSREVQAGMGADAREKADRVMDEMNPITTRLDGTLLDQTRQIPASLAAEVRVPTLVVHCQDDGLVPVAQGKHTHAAIPTSEMVTYPTGGHFLAGHMDEVQETVRAFLQGAE